MQSLYNVIKSSNVIPQGNKEIQTEVYLPKKIQENIREKEASNLHEEITEKQMENYETLARILVENARRKSEEILSKAYSEAQKIEKETYENTYKMAYAEGQQKGYEDAYNELMPKTKAEAESLINNAKSLLFDAKCQYEAYLESKQDEIIKFAVNIAEQVLKRELGSKDGLNDLIYEAIKESRSAATFIIRVASIYVDEIKSNLSDWKESLGIKSEIFVVPDDTVTEGNALIEKSNGKIEVGIDIGLKNIKEELF